jgi:predicted nucleic acid-binding protein
VVILADTSTWIDHFRRSDLRLHDLARNGDICSHPFVTGELAAGSLHVRHRVLLMLRNLPQLEPVNESEYFDFLERHEVNGKGLGFVDIHLLAAAEQAGDVQVWTKDGRMLEQAERLGLNYKSG